MHLSLAMIYDLSGEYYSTAPSLQYQISEAFEVPTGLQIYRCVFLSPPPEREIKMSIFSHFSGGKNQDNQKLFGKKKKKRRRRMQSADVG